MVFSFLSHFTKPLPVDRDESSFDALTSFASKEGQLAFESVDLFYHNEHARIPFLLIDRYRGAFLFDSASWCFEEVQHAEVVPASEGKARAKDIDVDSAKRLFMRKLDEILLQEQCEACNFVYLPNLNREEFDSLDPSFKRLIPASRTIFSDDTEASIARKLADALPLRKTPIDLAALQSALFVQYTLLADACTGDVRQLSPAQKAYVDAKLPKRSLLSGTYGSGKTSLLLLKALREKLHNPHLDIAIVVSTTAAAELLAQNLLELLEYAVVHVDPTSIRILSPRQVCREHYIKVHNEPPVVDGNITDKMLRRRHDLADVLFLDDAHLLDERYINYFEYLQMGKELHVATLDEKAFMADASYNLNHAFRSPHSITRYLQDREAPHQTGTLFLHEGNGYIVTLHLLQKLFQEYQARDILIAVPHESFAETLQESVTDFIGCTSTLFEPHKTLLNQDMEQLLIAPIDGLSGLQRPCVIVIYDDKSNEASYLHAVSRAQKRAYLIHHRSE